MSLSTCNYVKTREDKQLSEVLTRVKHNNQLIDLTFISLHWIHHTMKRGRDFIVIDHFTFAGISTLAFEWMWGSGWPYFDTNRLSFVMETLLENTS